MHAMSRILEAAMEERVTCSLVERVMHRCIFGLFSETAAVAVTRSSIARTRT